MALKEVSRGPLLKIEGVNNEIKVAERHVREVIAVSAERIQRLDEYLQDARKKAADEEKDVRAVVRILKDRKSQYVQTVDDAKECYKASVEKIKGSSGKLRKVYLKSNCGSTNSPPREKSRKNGTTPDRKVFEIIDLTSPCTPFFPRNLNQERDGESDDEEHERHQVQDVN